MLNPEGWAKKNLQEVHCAQNLWTLNLGVAIIEFITMSPGLILSHSREKQLFIPSQLFSSLMWQPGVCTAQIFLQEEPTENVAGLLTSGAMTLAPSPPHTQDGFSLGCSLPVIVCGRRNGALFCLRNDSSKVHSSLWDPITLIETLLKLSQLGCPSTQTPFLSHFLS